MKDSGKIKSRIKGVTFNKNNQKWYARFTYKGEKVWVGAYNDLYEAAKNLAKKQAEYGMSLMSSDAIRFMKEQDLLRQSKKKQEIVKKTNPQPIVKTVQNESYPVKEDLYKVWEVLKTANIRVNIYFNK